MNCLTKSIYYCFLYLTGVVLLIIALALPWAYGYVLHLYWGDGIGGGPREAFVWWFWPFTVTWIVLNGFCVIEGVCYLMCAADLKAEIVKKEKGR